MAAFFIYGTNYSQIYCFSFHSFTDHSPRDFLPVQESYQEPTYTVNNVLDAVNLIFKKQNFNVIENQK